MQNLTKRDSNKCTNKSMLRTYNQEPQESRLNSATNLPSDFKQVFSSLGAMISLIERGPFQVLLLWDSRL